MGFNEDCLCIENFISKIQIIDSISDILDFGPSFIHSYDLREYNYCVVTEESKELEAFDILDNVVIDDYYFYDGENRLEADSINSVTFNLKVKEVKKHSQKVEFAMEMTGDGHDIDLMYTQNLIVEVDIYGIDNSDEWSFDLYKSYEYFLNENYEESFLALYRAFEKIVKTSKGDTNKKDGIYKLFTTTFKDKLDNRSLKIFRNSNIIRNRVTHNESKIVKQSDVTMMYGLFISTYHVIFDEYDSFVFELSDYF